MVETRDLEVISIEINQITQDFLEEFVKSCFEYLVLLNQGRYIGIVSTDILSRNGKWMTDSIVYDNNVFQNARKYFEIEKNRGSLLGLTDADGNLLTFLVWNQRAESTITYREFQKEKLLHLLKAGRNIELRNWDEYTDECYRNLKSYSNNIILSGRNWEICGERPFDGIEQLQNRIVVDKNGICFPVKEFLVETITELKPEFQDKKWYVWMDSWLSLTRLAELVFDYGFIPDGLCELRQYRETQRVLGIDVIDVESIANQEEIIILVDFENEKQSLKKYVSEEKIVLFRSLFQHRASLIKNNVFQTWGGKEELEQFRRTMPEINVSYRNRNDENETKGLLLWEFCSNKSAESYREYISEINKNVRLYTPKRIYETKGSASASLKIKIFDKAIEENRKCILYGIESHYTNYWIKLLETFHLSYEIMEDEEIKEWYGYEVASIYDLPNRYHPENVLVIVNKPYEKFPTAVKLLQDYGISMEDENCISIYEQFINQKLRYDYFDICAGKLSGSLAESKYPGYYIIGEDNPDDYKIMVVGSSSSDATLYTLKSWPEILYELLRRDGKKITLYDGAVSEYYSGQELSKVMRDTRILKPNMIISFSGINDTGEVLRRGKSYVNGVIGDNGKNSFEFWLENEKMMQQIASWNGASFYCFAEPQLYQNEHMGKYEKLFTKWRRQNKNVDQEWKKKVNNIVEYRWMVDLTGIFDENPEVYFDVCHMKTKGNEIIAQKVYEHIKQEIQGSLEGK